MTTQVATPGGMMSTNGDSPVLQPTDYTFKPTEPAELRARLQPVLLVRIIEPVESIKGRLRFKKGDLVMAQYWGNGLIMLYPTNPQDYPAAFVLNHNIEGHVAAVELGELKGQPARKPLPESFPVPAPGNGPWRAPQPPPCTEFPATEMPVL